MKKIIVIVAVMLAGLSTYAQSNKKAVAEQTVWAETSASVKISTSSDKIFTELSKKFGVKKYSVEIKEDRMGVFKVYSMTFKKDRSPELTSYFKEYNK